MALTAEAADVWQKQPRLMLWAWEMPCDMRFVDKDATGIAYLAGVITLKNERVISKPRTQMLLSKPGTFKMAVVRIEVNRASGAKLSEIQMREVLRQVQRLAEQGHNDAVQIDFDAKQSERLFYKNLLTELRRVLPPAMPLSITALSSWCLQDVWVKQLDCDEVVPMFFSMGPARNEALEALSEGGRGLAKLPMQESLGLSVNDVALLKKFPHMTKHVYLFSRLGWKHGSVLKWVRCFEDGESGWKRLP
jgi:hypothetical protein